MRWVVLLPVLSACGDPGTRIVVVSHDRESQRYLLRAEDFETLDDARELDGSVTRVLGGAEFVVDERVLTAPTLEQALDRAVREEGNAVKFSAVEGDDGWVPADYDSLSMASIYRNLERAAALFQDLGVAFAELGQIRTYYLLVMRRDLPGVPRQDQADNAAYSLIPGLDGFIVLKQRALDDLALGLNLGVMVHEYTHAVMARFRWGTPPQPDLLATPPCAAAMIEEGSSDYFGFFATGDPDFIAPSVPPALADRDLSVERTLTDAEVLASQPPCTKKSDAHLVGATWAALLWAIGEQIGHDALAPILVDALREFAPLDAPSLATLPDLVVSRLSGQARVAACDLIDQRFAPVAGSVSSCVVGP